MSRLFGEIRQMGYVVRDIEDAMHHWIEVCGVTSTNFRCSIFIIGGKLVTRIYRLRWLIQETCRWN